MENTANIYQLPSPDKSPSLTKKKSFLDDLRSINRKKIIKLRAKKIANKSYSLYLDIWYNQKREYHFLKLYILNRTDTKKRDQETLKLAIEYRDKKELELFQNDHEFELSSYKQKADFIEYFKFLVYKKSKPDKSWKHTLKHLKIFKKGKITFKQVDDKFCESFKKYLEDTLSPNTAHTYFAKIKASLNIAIKDKIIIRNPAQFLHIKKEETKREFLNIDELKLLKNTPCKNEQTKRAFLFTCFTGLRISDVKKLTFDEIQSGYLDFRQKKTKGIERLKLSASALEIIKDQKNNGINTGKVFKLIADNHTGEHIKEWSKAAGLRKKITWHTGRHTFATLALTYDTDLYTVSKLLGHREIKTTQLYARLIDRKKDEAIDKLPKI